MVASQALEIVIIAIKVHLVYMSAFCNVDRLGVPKQAVGGIPLDFGIVMEDRPSELSCSMKATKITCRGV